VRPSRGSKTNINSFGAKGRHREKENERDTKEVEAEKGGRPKKKGEGKLQASGEK